METGKGGEGAKQLGNKSLQLTLQGNSNLRKTSMKTGGTKTKELDKKGQEGSAETDLVLSHQ